MIMNTMDIPTSVPCGVGTLARLRKRERGSTLAAVLIILAVLVSGLGSYLSSIRSIWNLQEQRIMDDRAQMAAEAGLAKAISKLWVLIAPPIANTVWNLSVPSADFWPFQTVTVNIYPTTIGSQQAWTIVSTSVSDATDKRHQAIARRVQAMFLMDNFAKYEFFVNNYGGVWGPGWYQFEGFGSTYLGLYHVNTGIAFWPNFWANKEVTSAASGGVRYFADWSTYNVYGDPAANNYVNILNYYSSTWSQSPKFYGGITTLPAPISLPADMNTDARAVKLRQNDGLTLPAGYSGYDSTKGANFTVDIVSATSNPADSQVVVKQYLGKSGSVPLYGSTRTYNINGINNSMIVYGNISSLKGTLNGKLTIAAMKSATVSGTGAIDITGDLQYKSRMANAEFQYADSAALYTANGADINQAAVDGLLNQANTVTDSLGLISEKDILIKERDLDGNRIAAGTAVYVDATVMAKGANSGTADGGQFGPENPQTRPIGTCYIFGGSVQNYQNFWAQYSGSTQTNGLQAVRLWDKRNYQQGGGPPNFPTTGNLILYAQSYRSGYVKNATDTPLLP